MRTLLLNLPGVRPFLAPLGISSLTAYLKNQGYGHVQQQDLNIYFFDHIFTPDAWTVLKERYVDSVIKDLNSKPDLSRIEISIYRQAVRCSAYMDRLRHDYKQLRDKILSREAFNNYQTLHRWSTLLLQKSEMITILPEFIAASRANRQMNDFKQLLGGTSLFGRQDDCAFFEFMFNEASVRELETSAFGEFLKPLVSKICGDEDLELIGFSFSYPQQSSYLPLLAKCIKMSRPDIHITVGGGVVSIFADLIPFNPYLFNYIDSFIPYEGEKPLIQLVRAIETSSGDLSAVSNLIYKDHGDEIKVNSVSEPLHIDALPTPDFETLPIDRYYSPEPLLPLLTSRGCYWKRCTFCVHWHTYTKSSFRNIELLLHDVQSLVKKYGVKHFYFVDDALNPSYLQKMSDQFLSHGVNIHWGGCARIEKGFSDDHLVKKLALAGCRVLFLGFESSILGLMKKGSTRSLQQKVVDRLNKHGISIFPLFFLGFPGETREEAMETIEFIRSNKEKFTKNTVIGTFVLCRGSPIFRDPDTFGITLNESKTNKRFIGNFSYRSSEGLSSLEAGLMLKEVSQELLNQMFCIPELYYLVLKDEEIDRPRQSDTVNEEVLPSADFLKIVPRHSEHLYLVKSHYPIFDEDQGVNKQGKKLHPGGKLFHYMVKTCSDRRFALNARTYTILQAMDGKRTLEEIYQKLHSRDSAILNLTTFRQIITLLKKRRLICLGSLECG